MASHLMSFGLDVTEALVRMTRNPALIIGRPELGTLVEGGIGDCTILREVEEKTRFIDVDGRMRDGRKRLVADAVIRHGELVTDSIVASHRGGGENGLR
jgi:dihydroorotase